MHEACLIAGGSLPTLAKGADDIFWVHQLQDALVAKGYYPDEDEMGDWYFGDHTTNALSMFQACTRHSGTRSCIYKLVTLVHLLTLTCSFDCNVLPAGALRAAVLTRRARGCQRRGCATWPPGVPCWATTASRACSSRRLGRCAALCSLASR